MKWSDDTGASDGGGRQTLADMAYQQLEHQIITLAFLPGDVISESRVVARLGLGRTPVREALLRLRYARLIEPGQGRSHVVTPLDFGESLQINEVARLLDRLMVERAVVQRSALEAKRFEALAEAFPTAAASHDVDAYLQAHSTLNRLIGESARQPVAARSMAPLIALSRRLAVVHVKLNGMALTEFAPAHARLARSIAEGDGPAAVSALDSVLDRWVEIIESLAATAAVRDVLALLRAAR